MSLACAIAAGVVRYDSFPSGSRTSKAHPYSTLGVTVRIRVFHSFGNWNGYVNSEMIEDVINKMVNLGSYI